MTVIGALSSLRKRREMSPHERACRHQLQNRRQTKSDNRLYFRLARDASAVGNGKQRKATSADREPHDYCGGPVL